MIHPPSQALDVEFDVSGEEVEDGRFGQGTAVAAEFGDQVGSEFLLDDSMAGFAVIDMRFGDGDVGVEAAVEVGGAGGDVVHLGVVREVHGLRCVAHQAVDGSTHFGRVELGRAGRRLDELAAVDVKLAVGKPEHVAGEDGLGLLVDDADVVLGVARGVDHEQFAAAELDGQAFVGVDDALGRDGQDVAVDVLDVVLAVNRGDAGDKLGGLGHVARAARMDDELGVREFAHERAGAAGVVEVDMGEDDVIDSIAAEADLVQRFLHIGQRVVAAGIDEGNAAVVDDHVDGGQDGAHIAGVEGDDAVVVISPVEHFHTPAY